MSNFQRFPSTFGREVRNLPRIFPVFQAPVSLAGPTHARCTWACFVPFGTRFFGGSWLLDRKWISVNLMSVNFGQFQSISVNLISVNISQFQSICCTATLFRMSNSQRLVPLGEEVCAEKNPVASTGDTGRAIPGFSESRYTG